MAMKVLIVDDEKLERVLIRKGFDWEGHGFTVVGEASSGEEALSLVAIHEPQVILTDINMDGMNGLTLSENILKVSPKSHLVIITGFREFEYARKALKIGVEDFLLKPVSMADLSLVALKIKEKMAKEREEEEAFFKLKEQALADQKRVMARFFQQAIEGDLKEKEVLEKLKVFHFQSLVQGFGVLSVRLEEEAKSLQSEAVRAFITDHLAKNFEHMVFVHYQQKIIVVLATKEEDTLMAVAKEVQHLVETSMELPLTIGVSGLQKDIGALSKAYKEADRALSASVLLGKHRCISYGAYQELLHKNMVRKDLDWEAFTFAMEHGLVEKVEVFIKDYVDLMRSSNITDIDYYRLMTMDMLSKAATTLHKFGATLGEVIPEDALYEDIQRIATVDEVTPYLVESLKKIMAFHKKKKSKRGRKVVEDALAYVDEEIFSPELSLKTVAASIYSNESYLSRVFKKEMGLSLIDYILKKRIEESIRLLNTTDLKVYEIAERIGFRDAHYFSICFKKFTGVTAKEFKKDQGTS